MNLWARMELRWGMDGSETRIPRYLDGGIITLTLYMVLPLFATRFADYAGGIRVAFIQPRLF